MTLVILVFSTPDIRAASGRSGLGQKRSSTCVMIGPPDDQATSATSLPTNAATVGRAFEFAAALTPLFELGVPIDTEPDKG